jgi:microcystin-dependent protein
MNAGILGELPSGLFQKLALWLVPIGVGFDWWCDEADVPKGYIVPYGQDIEQHKYPRLYAKWCKNGVHRHGAGSTPTSTKAPDKRGRHSIGKDDMGGTAANRVTAGQSGIAGNTLGAAGGDERLHAHAHTVNDPTHGHGHNAAAQNSTNTSTVTAPGYGNNNYNPAAATINAAGTGITLQNAGAGGSQNMGPSIVCNYIIRAG